MPSAEARTVNGKERTDSNESSIFNSPPYTLTPCFWATGQGTKGNSMTFPPWAIKPEFYIPILVSVLFFILSLYGPDIRRAIDTRPTKTRNWWKSVRVNGLVNELDLL